MTNRGSAMFLESLEEVPETWRSKFVEVEIDGKKGYQDEDSVKAFNLAKNLKAEKQDLQAKVGEFSERLTTFEKSQAAAIEKARADALEEAKSKGDVAAIEKQYKEQMADLERRTTERVRSEMEKEFSIKNVQQEAKIELKDIVAALNPHDDTRATLELIVAQRQRIDENGKKVYLNADGSASTLDKNGLVAELLEDAAIKRLIKPSHVVENGGLANGSSGGSATQTMTRSAFEALSPTEKMKRTKQGVKII